MEDKKPDSGQNGGPYRTPGQPHKLPSSFELFSNLFDQGSDKCRPDHHLLNGYIAGLAICVLADTVGAGADRIAEAIRGGASVLFRAVLATREEDQGEY